MVQISFTKRVWFKWQSSNTKVTTFGGTVQLWFWGYHLALSLWLQSQRIYQSSLVSWPEHLPNGIVQNSDLICGQSESDGWLYDPESERHFEHAVLPASNFKRLLTLVTEKLFDTWRWRQGLQWALPWAGYAFGWISHSQWFYRAQQCNAIKEQEHST